MLFRQKKKTTNEFPTISDRLNLTISVTNISDFVSLSEEVDDKKVFEILNKYHAIQQALIKEAGGFVKISAPDGVMGYWGLDNMSNHAVCACQCALRQIMATKKLNEFLEKENLPALDVSIGINTGDTIVSIDEQTNMIIGESVNLAFYACDSAKELGKPVVISENTNEQLVHSIDFVVREIEPLVHNNSTIRLFEIRS